MNLSGVVRDAQTGKPLAGANIRVLGTAMAISTDAIGQFDLRGLPAGQYDLQISHIGYEDFLKSDILVREGETSFLSIAMKPTVLLLPAVVVSTEAGQRVREPSVTIIERRDLENLAGKDVGDALRSAAGVVVLEEGGPGGRKIVSLRGARPDQVVVELDGVALNAASGGAVDLSQFPIEQIERIEIVRGANAGAMGGRIRIITRKPNPSANSSSMKVAAAAGSFAYQEAMAQLQIPISKAAFEFHLRHAHSDGDFTYEAQGIEKKRINNEYGRWLGQVGGSWQVAKDWRWNLLASGDYRDRGSPGMIAQAPTPEARLREQPWRVTSNLVWQTTRFEATLTNFYHFQRRKYQSPREQYDPNDNQTYYHAPVWTEDEDQARGGSLIGAAFDPPPRNWMRKFSAGIHFRQDAYRGKDLLSGSSIPDRSIGTVFRNTFSVHGQADCHLPKKGDLLQWTTEGRMDVVDQTELEPDIHATGRLRMSVAPMGDFQSCWNVVFSGGYGSSYRLPSFVSLFLVENSFAVGNKNLRPERGQGGDAGVLLQFRSTQRDRLSSVELSATAFLNRIEDMIIWRPNFRGQYFPDNVAVGETRGIELSGQMALFDEDLTLRGHATLQRARNKTPESRLYDKVLPLQPELQGRASLEWLPTPFEFLLQYRAMGRRYTSEDNTDYLSTAQRDLKPFAVLDLGLGWQKNIKVGKVSLRGQVNNLLNESHMIIERSPMPGRAYEMRLSFER